MTDAKKQWEIYTKTELSILGPLLAKQGIELDYNQPHISGERFLMSGKKVVLIGKSIDSGERLIIKSSADVSGIGEIEKERLVRQTLEKLPFAYSPSLHQKSVGLIKMTIELSSLRNSLINLNPIFPYRLSNSLIWPFKLLGC